MKQFRNKLYFISFIVSYIMLLSMFSFTDTIQNNIKISNDASAYFYTEVDYYNFKKN